MSENKVSANRALKKRKMGMISIVAFIFGSCAAGAFGTEQVISSIGPGAAIALILGLPLIWAIPYCLTVAELSSVLPGEGGPYYWVRETMGEYAGFIAGWMGVCSYYFSNATFVVLAVGYLEFMVELTDAQATFLKVAIVLIFTFINLLGIKEVGIVSVIFSAIVLIGFMIVTVVGFANWNTSPVEPFLAEGTGLKDGIGGALGIGIWMYCGYNCISYASGELEKPRMITKAILVAIPIIILSYALPTVAGLASVGNWESWSNVGGEWAVGFSSVLTQFVRPALGGAFLIIAIISQFSMFNNQITSGSRVFFVLADDNLIPKWFGKISKRGVPYIAILIYTAITLFLLQFEFQVLVLISVIPVFVVWGMACAALLIARKKFPNRDNLYTIPGGKVGLYYAAGCPIIVGLIVYLVNGTDYFLGGMFAMVLILLLYFVCKPMYGGLNVEHPEQYPINPRTKLGIGDTYKVAVVSLVTAVICFISIPVLKWYEGDWAEEYYSSTYDGGLFSDFSLMLNIIIAIGVLLCGLAAVMYYMGKKEIKSIKNGNIKKM